MYTCGHAQIDQKLLKSNRVVQLTVKGKVTRPIIAQPKKKFIVDILKIYLNTLRL